MVSAIAARQLGITSVIESPCVQLSSDSTEEQLQRVITAAYQQVFGNAHLMEGEYVKKAESQLRQGEITVREFIRSLALSESYRERFFYSTSQVRFIELNYKHLLGRSPGDESEISNHVALFHEQGYEAEINSYIDSQEYQASFGEDTVPYYRGFNSQNNSKNVGFSRMFQLYRGHASSDSARGNLSSLTYELANNTASAIRNEMNDKTIIGTTGGSQGQIYRVQVSQGATAGSPQIRIATREYLIPFYQLSSTLKQLGKRGDRITSITPA